MSTQIPFTTYVQRSNNDGPEREITAPKLYAHRKSGPKSLFEWIQKCSQTKLYFDYDGGDITEAITFYVNLGKRLNVRWTLCGYYTNEDAFNEFANALMNVPEEQLSWVCLEYIDPELIKCASKAAKRISFHVVYDIIANIDDMVSIIAGFKCPFIDTTVYVGRGGRQLFRHPYYNKGDIKCGLLNVEDIDEKLSDDVFLKSFVLNVEESFEVATRETLSDIFTDELKRYAVTNALPVGVTADINAVPQVIPNDPRRRKPKTTSTFAPKPTPKQPMSDELAQAFVDGLTGIPINGYSNLPMDDEVSLCNAFSAVYALPDKFIPQGLDNVLNKCALTVKAKATYVTELERFKRKNTSSYGCLMKLINVWNPDHFDDVVKPILDRENETKILIDDVKSREEELMAWDFNILTDGFSKTELYEKAPYGSIADVIIDLKRIMIEVTSDSTMYVYKFPGTTESNGRIVFKTFNEMVTEFAHFPIGRTSNRANAKELTAWDIYKKYSKYFRMKRFAFNSDVARTYNIFRGLPYTPTQTLDREMIQPYLNHIHDIITDNNDIDYDFLIKWIASIIQKPGFKTAMAPVLVGAQGTGKGIFTDVISNLIGCYAWRNAERACDVTGKNNGNLENKMFVVLNEARDANSKNCLEGDRMKTLITESSMNIEDKYVKSHQADNVLNFIMCTNNYHPIEMDETDRRYMPLKVSSARIGDTAYFETLVELMKRDEFYENLMRFFLDVDLTNFNSRKPPTSALKDEMKQAGWSNVDWFVRREFMTIFTARVSTSLYTLFDKYCTERNLKKVLDEPQFLNEIHSKYIETKNKKTQRVGDTNTRTHYIFKFGVEPKLREWYDAHRDECEDYIEANDDISDRT